MKDRQRNERLNIKSKYIGVFAASMQCIGEVNVASRLAAKHIAKIESAEKNREMGERHPKTLSSTVDSCGLNMFKATSEIYPQVQTKQENMLD